MTCLAELSANVVAGSAPAGPVGDLVDLVDEGERAQPVELLAQREDQDQCEAGEVATEPLTSRASRGRCAPDASGLCRSPSGLRRWTWRRARYDGSRADRGAGTLLAAQPCGSRPATGWISRRISSRSSARRGEVYLLHPLRMAWGPRAADRGPRRATSYSLSTRCSNALAWASTSRRIAGPCPGFVPEHAAQRLLDEPSGETRFSTLYDDDCCPPGLRLRISLKRWIFSPQATPSRPGRPSHRARERVPDSAQRTRAVEERPIQA